MRNEVEERIKSFIVKRMGRGYECDVTDRDTKETYFIKSYDGGSTYHLYRGCDLEVGDVSLDYIVRQICRYHVELSSKVKKMYIGKWGGQAEVRIIKELGLLPQGSRYIESNLDDNLDIYESMEGVVYGVQSK